ncbi:MAG: 3-oxoacyl-ACP reductase [Gammaproteobacteria bacterium]|nr:3-oxoacyl-ACP reductase [Gammaproteobacteria bacterium]
MSDRYLEFSHSALGKTLVSLLGLPQPPVLKRGDGPWAQQPLADKPVLVGAATGSRFCGALLKALADGGAILRVRPEHPGIQAIKPAATELKLNLQGNPVSGEGGQRSYALVFDASGIRDTAGLRQLYDFFQPIAAQVPANGRVLVVARAPASADNAAAAACSAAMIGFVKSLGKEIGRKGATANLIEVADGAEAALAGPVRFILSAHSAFISGQSLALTPGKAPLPVAWTTPLSGKVALVTGAARGIGAAIAGVLAREGAQVLGVDRPQEEGALAETLSKIGGAGLALDITAPEAPERIARECQARFGGVDIVVHNAGITRDKTLRNMQPQWWDQVIDVNLGAILRINEKLLDGALRENGRMVCVSSIGGIAGNPGQTNYGATKAGVIGYCAALAPELAKRGGAVNAVAPGFIETQMTAMMPAGPRIVGRLMSSVQQGGLPADIAEAVAFLASPYAAGVNGRTLRVCGQHLVGA